MQRRISAPQKGIEAQKLFMEFLGFFICVCFMMQSVAVFAEVVAQLRALGPLYGSLPAAVLQLPEKTYEKESFHNGKQAK